MHAAESPHPCSSPPWTSRDVDALNKGLLLEVQAVLTKRAMARLMQGAAAATGGGGPHITMEQLQASLVPIQVRQGRRCGRGRGRGREGLEGAGHRAYRFTTCMHVLCMPRQRLPAPPPPLPTHPTPGACVIIYF